MAEKKARREGRIIVFIDEAGFYLLPAQGRTYAPRGQRPRIDVKLTRDHLSVMGGLTTELRLYLRVQEHAFGSKDVEAFLRYLMSCIPGRLLVVWDGDTIHRSAALREFIRSLRGWIFVERLPGYAPDLNPVEGIWNILKNVELKNLSCPDVTQLRSHLGRASARIRHRTYVLRGCFTQAGLPLDG